MRDYSIKMDQKGFTLIEIIAVLVILGILAAVAVPKYFDMQKTSEYKGINSAAAEMKARATQKFGESMLENNGTPDITDLDTFDDLGITSANIGVELADYPGTWAYGSTVLTYTMANGGGAVTLTLTPGTAAVPAKIAVSAMP